MRKLFVLMLACMFIAGSATAGMAIVQINETNFPDATFRGYVRENFDTDKDGILSNNEILNAKDANVGNKGTDLRSLQGIKHLTSLEKLHCRADRLMELDLSGMTSLTYVDCTYATDGRLSTINLSGCSSLNELNCEHSGVTSINLTGCSSLKTIYANDNKLTSLNLKDCVSLKELYCYENAITELDFSSCPEVTRIDAYTNKLTSINVKKCDNLKRLDLCTNLLSVLDISGNPVLEGLWCWGNHITVLDVSGNVSLRILRCFNNRLARLDVEGNTSLSSSGNDYVCSPQNIDGLTVTPIGGKYTVNLSDYMSANIKNVVAGSMYGKDSDGNLLVPAYDSGTGIMTFDAQPASIYYDYDTKFSKDDTKRTRSVTWA